ncbi:hypothetical protein CN514_03610 [Bacillus sp. AFS001701]|nr:hypothetical protein CN514_03610 [Bacillus sp. AFS001701]
MKKIWCNARKNKGNFYKRWERLRHYGEIFIVDKYNIRKNIDNDTDNHYHLNMIAFNTNNPVLINGVIKPYVIPHPFFIWLSKKAWLVTKLFWYLFGDF